MSHSTSPGQSLDEYIQSKLPAAALSPNAATETTLAAILAKQSLTVGSDVTDRAARLLGHVTVDSTPGVTDAQMRATPIPVSGSLSSIAASASNSWAQSLAVTNGSTSTIINIASSTAGYKVTGFTANGTGDGYFFVQVNSVTILSGRTRSTLPSIVIALPNPVAITTASTVALKVTNESGSTADYEATLLGA